jgi:hypothetical protein
VSLHQIIMKIVLFSMILAAAQIFGQGANDARKFDEIVNLPTYRYGRTVNGILARSCRGRVSKTEAFLGQTIYQASKH